MWYEWQDIEWLPLFDFCQSKNEKNFSVAIQENLESNPLAVWSIVDLSICGSCGEKAFVWESEGWFCTNCRTYGAIPSEMSEEINVHNYETILEYKYKSDVENPWEIILHSVEDRDWYKVAVVTICHSHPGKKFIHKGRKLWPTGRRDGEMTFTKKVSKGKMQKKQYRIHYDPSNIESWIFIYGGEKKDGKIVELNSRSVKKIVGEINSISFNETLA